MSAVSQDETTTNAPVIDSLAKRLDESPTEGALPMFMQIAEHVARQISAGHLAPDTKLPPEREMAANYNVAVGTLRKSLARLTQMGLIARKQGSGNYISRTQGASGIYNFFRLELPKGGGLPSARVIDVVKLQKPDDLPEFGSSDVAIRFRRVRYLDDIPVALEEIWLDGSCTDEVSHEQISQSLYHYYQHHLGLIIAKAEDWISIAPPPKWHKAQSEDEANEQMGFIERFGWSQHGNKIEYSRTWYAPLRARYVSRLK